MLSIPGIAMASLRSRPLRGLALTAATALLAALVSFALLFVSSARNALRTAAERLGADIVLVPVGAMERPDEFLFESRKKLLYMDSNVLARVRSIKGVAAATPQTYLRTLASACCSIAETQVIAFDPASDFVVTPWLAEGRMPGPGEVLAGSYAYEHLGLIDTPSLFGRRMKLSGHLRRTGTGLDQALFMRAGDLARISPAARGNQAGMSGKGVSIVFVKTAPGQDPIEVAARIQSRIFDAGVLTRGGIGQGVAAMLEDMGRIFSVTVLVSALLTIMLAWSAFSAIIAERRQDIGVLRALGANRRQVMAIFLFEAGTYAAAGGGSGALAGIAIARGLASGLHLTRSMAAAPIPAAAYILAAAAAAGAALAVCLSGAAAAVMKTTRLEPGRILTA